MRKHLLAALCLAFSAQFLLSPTAPALADNFCWTISQPPPTGIYGLVLPACTPQGALTAGINSTGPTAPVACDSSVAVNITSATTTTLVPLSGTTMIYVCQFTLEFVSGTTPSFYFEYGFGTNCIAAPVALTGTFQSTTSNNVIIAGSGYGFLFRGGVGNNLCLVSGGTTPSIQGYVTYSRF